MSEQRFTLGQTFRVCVLHGWAGNGNCPLKDPPHPPPSPPFRVVAVDRARGIVTISSEVDYERKPTT